MPGLARKRRRLRVRLRRVMARFRETKPCIFGTSHDCPQTPPSLAGPDPLPTLIRYAIMQDHPVQEYFVIERNEVSWKPWMGSIG